MNRFVSNFVNHDVWQRSEDEFTSAGLLTGPTAKGEGHQS